MLFNVVVWPFRSGEVCVQSYNSVLTLAKLSQVCASVAHECTLHQPVLPAFGTQITVAAFKFSSQTSDGILLLENEVASAVCKQLLGLISPSFSALNSVLARAICMLVLPAEAPGPCSSHITPFTLIQHLCSHPVSTVWSVFLVALFSCAPAMWLQAFRIITARMLPMVASVPEAFLLCKTINFL